MNENEKPLSALRFWSWDLILLAGINLVFLGLIAGGCFLLFRVVAAPVQAWLGRILGV